VTEEDLPQRRGEGHELELGRGPDQADYTETRVEGKAVRRIAGRVAEEVEAKMSHHQGPIPDPETLKAYNEVVPDGADRIFSVWEGEVKHRQKLQRLQLWFAGGSTILGQVFGLLVVLTFAGGAIYLIADGKTITGLIVMLPSLGLVALHFITGGSSGGGPAEEADVEISDEEIQQILQELENEEDEGEGNAG
jgi:uncharacterized membrane protein